MDYKTMTLEDIDRLQEEIDQFYHYRHLMIGIGWACMGLTILFAILASVSGTQGEASFLMFAWLAGFSFVAAIVLWILKSALYNQRIRNRKILIKRAKEYQKDRKLFETQTPEE
jgi:cellobiose-specific phosphotransferase system component IIC